MFSDENESGATGFKFAGEEFAAAGVGEGYRRGVGGEGVQSGMGKTSEADQEANSGEKGSDRSLAPVAAEWIFVRS